MKLDWVLAGLHPSVPLLPGIRRQPADLCEVDLFTSTIEIDRLTDMVRSQADAARIPGDLPWLLEEGAWEMCDNALTHAQWLGGGVLAAQLYRLRGEIEYAVGDAGVGVLESLRPAYPMVADDAAAIIKAREYGVTRFGQDRRGAGLSETVDQVMTLDGRVVIRSGRATVTFQVSGMSSSISEHPWTGTLVKVVVPLPR